MKEKLKLDQAILIKKLLSKLNGNIEFELVDGEDRPLQTEGGQKIDVISVSIEDLEKHYTSGGKAVVDVDESIIKKIPKIIKKSNEARNWYKQFNRTIINMLGDSRGALFLCLVAFTSARTQLQSNIRTATDLYDRFINDYENDKEKLYEFIKFTHKYKNKLKIWTDRSGEAGKGKKGFGLKQKMRDVHNRFVDGKLNPFSKYQDLKVYPYVTFELLLENHWLMASKLFINFIENNGDINPKILSEFMASAMTSTIEVDDDRDDQFTNGLKIFNFALNLLNPSMDIKIGSHSWFPVTIDTWMIYFFYPEILDWESSKKSDFKGDIMKTYFRYGYLGKIVQEQAKKHDMEPHELQAIIWVSVLKKEKPNSARDLSSSLELILKQLDKKNNTSKSLLKILKNWKSRI